MYKLRVIRRFFDKGETGSLIIFKDFSLPFIPFEKLAISSDFGKDSFIVDNLVYLIDENIFITFIDRVYSKKNKLVFPAKKAIKAKEAMDLWLKEHKGYQFYE